MVAGNIFYYEALTQEKAMTVTPLTALYPLVTVALALVFLREKPHALQVCGIAVALAAMFIFGLDLKRDSLQGMADWRSIAAYVLLPICLWGVAGLLQKLSTNYASSELSSFWFQAAPLPAAVILFARRDVGLSHSPREWFGFLLIGLLLGLGNLALIASFGSGGKASIVTPLSGLYSVVAIPLAMLFGERAGRREAGVIALALIAVVLLSWERPKST
jgi:drug/metabolite transporter (DMT)-like permease